MSERQKPKILIIDDDEPIRNLLVELLRENYDCTSVASAEDALLVLFETEFEVVISDINMTGISGLDLLPHVQEASPDTAVIMISGQQTIESAIDAIRGGAFDYIMKPLELNHVEAAVARAQRHHQLLQQKRSYETNLEELVRERAAQLEHLSYHDVLTGLPNRVLFQDRVAQALSVAQPAGRIIGIVFLSLDRFKKINDTLGHTFGDYCLTEVAARLQQCIKKGQTIARLDGDEFALLLPQIEGTEDVVDVAQLIAEALKQSFNLKDREVFVTASLGMSIFPDDGHDATTVLKNAGAALHMAKMLGGNNYRFYTSDMNARAVKRLELETNLRRALERQELEVYYQPQVEYEFGKVVGAEALVRWNHPQLGFLPPSEFIPLAEDTGLIEQLGQWVMRTACAEACSWHAAGFEDLRISVNVSGREFRQAEFYERLVGILSETGLDAKCLELELTETTIMDNTEAAVDLLKRIRKLGVMIAIDDFGTGYSSLSYLKRLPIDTLKLDRSFVNGATTDPDDAALVMAVITLAHNLRLKVMAEGVETEEHLRFLRLLRCDGGQGYLFGKPMPAAIFRATLDREIDYGKELVFSVH